MKKKPILLIAFITGLVTACIPFPPDKQQESGNHPPFVINANGDTVKISYYPNGNKSSEYTVRNRMMNGVAYNYYENGQVKNKINYIDGLQEGWASTYYENGALYRESKFVKGEIDGIQKRYYEDGKLMAEVPYKNGDLRTGTKEYNREGKQKDNFSEILLNLEDRAAFEGEFILHISLSKNQKGTNFYKEVIIDGDTAEIGIPTTDSKGKLSWKLRKGGYVMEKMVIVAEYITILGNPVRIEKTYNLAIENR